MADDNRKSIKIRLADHEVLKSEAVKRPVQEIDLFTAWRLLWQSASEKQRAKVLSRVHKVDAPAAA